MMCGSWRDQRGLRLAALSWVAALLLCALPSRALDPLKSQSQYIYDRWTSDNGLPENVIQAILQTSDGFLWLGTQDGLARFDGVTFRVFRPGDTPALRSTNITCLFEDGTGRLWIGGEGGGLTSFFKGEWQSHGEVAGGLSSTPVYAAREDKAGALWVATYNGLDRFAGSVWRTYTRADGLPTNRARALCLDREGTLWIGFDGGGLLTWDGTRFVRPELPDFLADASVRAILCDGQNGLWVGTAGDGVARFSGGRWEHFATLEGLQSDRVNVLCQDRDGQVWAGTEGGGLSRFYQGRWSSFTAAQGLASNIVRSLFEDADGNLWIGSLGGGLERLRSGSWTVFGEREGLTAGMAWCTYEDREGALWVGTEGGISRQKEGVWSSYTTREGLPHNRVRSIFQDRLGGLWVGTAGGGVARFTGGRFVAEDVPGMPRDAQVTAFAEDASGTVWAATLGGGVFRRDLRTWNRISLADNVLCERVRALIVDRGGTLWAGTYGCGVLRFSDGKWTRVTGPGAPADLVLCLHEDREGAIWVGTANGGMSRYDGRRWTVYTRADGLCVNEVYQILEDGGEHLWLSSNGGVSRLSIRELEDFADGRSKGFSCRTFDKEDGLKSAECSGGSQPAGWTTRSGQLWFTTMNGVARLDPRQLPPARPPPPVYIDEVLVNHQPVSEPAAFDRLPAGAQDLELRYAGVSLTSAGRIHYSYKLEGFDPDWTDAGTRRTAFYTNLPPGSYVFRVRARSSDGTWSAPGTSFAFRFRHKFYQTWWFMSLLALAVGLGVPTLLVVRTRRANARAAYLERLVDRRTRQLADANARLEVLSATDGLTGVANRRRLDEFLETEWKRAVRARSPIAIIIADIDRFKVYNDRYGHQTGDLCLKLVAGVLASNLKRAGDLVARYGGDEFVIVLTDTDLEGAEAVAETLRVRVAEASGAEGAATGHLPVTLSLGVASAVPTLESGPWELFDEADRKLYRAKAQGRDGAAEVPRP